MSSTCLNDLLEDMDNLRHMLGVRLDLPSSRWCYRNYYNAHPENPSMARLVHAGLAEQFRPEYWRATHAGMRAIGLTEKQIKKAMDQ